jgi:hypothetical protein
LFGNFCAIEKRNRLQTIAGLNHDTSSVTFFLDEKSNQKNQANSPTSLFSFKNRFLFIPEKRAVRTELAKSAHSATHAQAERQKPSQFFNRPTNSTNGF